MPRSESWTAKRTRFANRMHARAATMSRSATEFLSTPEPKTIGSYARGRQLVGGNFLFSGFLVQAPVTIIWDLPMPDPAFEADLHGFTWLDDLAAVGDVHAVERAQEWTHEWVARYSGGTGPGWTPNLTGRRLIRWINHAILLLGAQDKAVSDAFFRSLSSQTRFLSRRWKAASPGLPRFEALTGMIYAGLALKGMEPHVDAAMQALRQECLSEIDENGGLLTRNPEELLHIFTLLTWAASALQDAGRTPAVEILDTISVVAPVLRALRHSDGGLARFHGGGRGLDGWLDRALATAGVRNAATKSLSMGFARMSHGRTSVIVDAAAPPMGEASANAHASTLALELTSGRRPLIVNCGSGATFGQSWRRAGRATPSHSTLGIEGYSSSRLGAAGRLAENEDELLIESPQIVRFDRVEAEGGTRFALSHDGYVSTHGLTHTRTLHMGFDGRELRGEDSLVAVEARDRKRFQLMLDRTSLQGIDFAIRFHLHPDVDASLDMNGTAVSMVLKSSEVWVFRCDGPVEMELDSSVYLENARLSPRATKQVVLSGALMDYSTRVSWSLAKTQDTPNAVRDYAVDEIELA